MIDLENRFEEMIIGRAERAKATQIPVDEPPIHPVPKKPHDCSKHHGGGDHKHDDDSCSSDDSMSEGEIDDEDEEGGSEIMEEWERRKKHPYRWVAL